MAKRTMFEIYNLILQKLENARNHYIRESKTSRTPNDSRMLDLLEGEMNAYTDIKCLIETSGVLDEK